jgi:hypothetical protein
VEPAVTLANPVLMDGVVEVMDADADPVLGLLNDTGCGPELARNSVDDSTV